MNKMLDWFYGIFAFVILWLGVSYVSASLLVMSIQNSMITTSVLVFPVNFVIIWFVTWIVIFFAMGRFMKGE